MTIAHVVPNGPHLIRQKLPLVSVVVSFASVLDPFAHRNDERDGRGDGPYGRGSDDLLSGRSAGPNGTYEPCKAAMRNRRPSAPDVPPLVQHQPSPAADTRAEPQR